MKCRGIADDTSVLNYIPWILVDRDGMLYWTTDCELTGCVICEDKSFDEVTNSTRSVARIESIFYSRLSKHLPGESKGR